MVAAESHFISSGGGPCHAHGHGHDFAAGASIAHHFSPRMEFAEEIREFDLFRAVQRGHIAPLERSRDGGVDIRIGVSQDAGADTAHGKVTILVAI